MNNINYPTPPTDTTKIISTTAVIFFLIGLGLGGYFVSNENGYISNEKFTISSALAHGNKPVMITFFTLSYLAVIYLIYIRGPKKYIGYRILLLILMYALIVAIIYITVDKNRKLHYIFAGIIFIANLIFVLSTMIIYNEYLKNKNNSLVYFLDINIILSFVAFITAAVFIDRRDDTVVDDEIFASSELLSVLTTLVVFIYIGFV